MNKAVDCVLLGLSGAWWFITSLGCIVPRRTPCTLLLGVGSCLCSTALPSAPALPHFFLVFGCGFVLSEGGPLPSSVGGVSNKASASIFAPSMAVPSRPPRSFWISPIYRPSVLLSLPLLPTSPMMRRMHFITATPAPRERVRH